MIDRILEFAQALWLVAFAFYAIDVARLVAPGRLLLRETSGRRFVPVLSSFPFEFAGRELVLAGFLVPWRAVFTARWSGPPAAEALALDRVDPLLDELTVLRVASTIGFLLLFVVAPVLTALFGLGYALLIVAPVVYPLNLAAGIVVLRRRETWHLGRGQAAWLLVDGLLCAPYGANWTQRITRQQPELALDVTQLRERFAADDFARLSGVIAVRRQQPGAEQ